MLEGDIPHPALRSLLEFESQKHGLKINYQTDELREYQNGDFKPQAEIVAHYGPHQTRFELNLHEKTCPLQGDVFFPEGEVIYSGEHPLGVVRDRHLFLAMAPELLYQLENPGRAMTQVFGPVVEKAMEMIADYLNNYDYGPEARLYSAYRMETEWRRHRQMQSDLSSNKFLIEEKAAELRELYRKNDELRRLISLWENHTQTFLKKSFEKEYKLLIRMVPRVLSGVSYTPGSLKVITNPIAIDYEGMEYEMGQYLIIIEFGAPELRIRNLYSSAMEFPHPHVNTDGVPCLGNLAPGINKLLTESDYLGLVEVLLQFLNSYNEDNPYLKIEHWDPDYHDEEEERRRYEECYHGVSPRDCVECDDESCPFLYEAEETCFQTSSLRDCITCSVDNCRYQERALQMCREDHEPWECVQCVMDCPFAGDCEDCFQSHQGEYCRGCSTQSCEYWEEANHEG